MGADALSARRSEAPQSISSADSSSAGVSPAVRRASRTPRKKQHSSPAIFRERGFALTRRRYTGGLRVCHSVACS